MIYIPGSILDPNSKPTGIKNRSSQAIAQLSTRCFGVVTWRVRVGVVPAAGAIDD
jgi:hypothetical protein